MAHPRGSTAYVVDDRSGDLVPDLPTAQRLSVRPLAADLATVLRELLAAGELANDHGRLVPHHRAEEHKP